MNSQNVQEPEYSIKLLLLGDLSVGKSSLIYRFIYDKFNPNEISTSELDLKTSDLIIDKKNVRVQLWDTVGQEKYKSITKNLIKRVQGIIIVYDITNKDSFKNIKTWAHLIEEEYGNKLPIIIVGNKIDLEENRKIKIEDAKAFCKNHKYKYVETSCKTGHNIKKSIAKICKIIIDSQNIRNDISFSLSTSNASYIKKKHCC